MSRTDVHGTVADGFEQVREEFAAVVAEQDGQVGAQLTATAGLPVIGTGLGIPAADLDWVLTAYALAFGGLLPVGGRVGDLFGRRGLFRAGLVVFLAASLLGGPAGIAVTATTSRPAGTPPHDALSCEAD
ncbi:MFS transporter [Streptosporangium sp. NBC_01639]|uniref:MFS transporter n=1 Tax=Streptosporangium sp. NBC_01639 TaxID=2975948 RepID=UPI00386C67D8